MDIFIFKEKLIFIIVSKDSIFGCCPDGITEAQGFKFEGCESEKFKTIERKDLFPLENGNLSFNFILHFSEYNLYFVNKKIRQ